MKSAVLEDRREKNAQNDWKTWVKESDLFNTDKSEKRVAIVEKEYLM